MLPAFAGGFSFEQLKRVFRAHLRLMVVVIVALLVIAAVLTFLVPKRYEAQAALVVDFLANDPTSSKTFPARLAESYMATQMNIITSQRVALQVVDRVGLSGDRDMLAAKLLKRLEVDTEDDSRVIELTYTGSDPVQAANIVNAFADAYRQTNLELTVVPAQERASKFEAQLAELRRKVNEAQRALTSYQRETGITDITERVDTETKRLHDLSNRLIAMEARSRKDELVAADARRRGGQLSAEDTGDYTQRLRSRLVTLEAELAQMEGVLGSNHPRYQSTQREIRLLRQRLGEQRRAAVQTLQSEARISAQREQSMRRELADQRQRVLDLKDQRDVIAERVRQLESAQSVYEAALNRYDEIKLDSEVRQANVEVITRATPPEHASHPKLWKNLLVAAVLGVILALGLAILAEMRKRRIRCKEDVERELQLPVLAELG